MKKIICSLLLIVFISLIIGCGKSKANIIGTWYYTTSDIVRSDIYYKFNKDKTGSYYFYGEEKKFTYEYDFEKITIKYEKANNKNEYEYKVKDNILTIKDSKGTNVTYKRR